MGKQTGNERWDQTLEKLVIEVSASEKVYGTLVQSDRYPQYRPYFQKRYFKQQHSAHILVDELYNVKGEKPLEPDVPYESIFSSLENRLLEDTMTDHKVDVLLISKEQELVLFYQRVLAHPELPGVTNAILQSQAEELNNMLYALRLDQRVKLRTNHGYV